MQQDKVEGELVKLRYFVGLTNDEAAEVLGISPRTAKHYWTHARAWLFGKSERQRLALPENSISSRNRNGGPWESRQHETGRVASSRRPHICGTNFFNEAENGFAR